MNRVVSILVLVLLASVAHADAEVWRTTQAVRGDTIHLPRDTATPYSLVTRHRNASFRITGPARVRIVSRSLCAIDARGSVDYVLLVARDRRPAEGFALTSERSTTRFSARRALTATREKFLLIPSGRHTVHISIPPDAPHSVLVRASWKPATLPSSEGSSSPRASENTGRPIRHLAVSPSAYAAAISIMAAERDATWYRATADTPVRVELFGPTTLRIAGRLEFTSAMPGEQAYVLDVREDGNRKASATLRTRRSDDARYRVARSSNRGRVPGTAQRLSIAVPAGLHAYSVRPRGTLAPGLLVSFSIPARDVARGETP